MKHVIAFIKDRKLSQVTHALHAIDGVTGMTAAGTRGFGRTRRTPPRHHIITDNLLLLEQRTRVDVFCSDNHVGALTLGRGQGCALLALALAGGAVSAYRTYVHYRVAA
jgi:nitrogen regulatory protein PII